MTLFSLSLFLSAIFCASWFGWWNEKRNVATAVKQHGPCTCIRRTETEGPAYVHVYVQCRKKADEGRYNDLHGIGYGWTLEMEKINRHKSVESFENSEWAELRLYCFWCKSGSSNAFFLSSLDILVVDSIPLPERGEPEDTCVSCVGKVLFHSHHVSPYSTRTSLDWGTNELVETWSGDIDNSNGHAHKKESNGIWFGKLGSRANQRKANLNRQRQSKVNPNFTLFKCFPTLQQFIFCFDFLALLCCKGDHQSVSPLCCCFLPSSSFSSGCTYALLFFSLLDVGTFAFFWHSLMESHWDWNGVKLNVKYIKNETAPSAPYLK